MYNYSAPAQLLKDRIILVTGAGDGIGKVAAKTYAQYGATVILLGKTIEKLEKVYDEIEKDNGPQPAIYPMNLEGATGKDFEDMQVTLDNEFGRLDGILHNAAMLGTLMPIAQYDMAHWGKVMQVNLNAPYMITRMCLPLLEKSQNASVIFTTDDVGVKGKAYWGAYGISKAAGDNMMQILADEMEVNTPIRFNSINPGSVATTLLSKAFPGLDPTNLPKPADIMNAYLYLMGDDSKEINGQIIYAQS
ncbi:MAG: YciK family oxidoreductase [gamma proteobacterium symbiont of Bathyaustriella thionipta]|nr:YciK family oxidoreductase [gamma proteobacterium symbiont of Bathyaustriella thionipta]MCU7949538.1 YciK family oxidoreductase [gamma proteobacterium symbiont of Bathyaustriella thionipta]MCU7952320.1 YciK family oxidoreductase [gamma proteobacterium symbiont of Bathyaustriella thionipta]MCU7956138.1 YciK family oxidoreductase [gamma proteobacterium symbiont of Bathyaustriella thionipta]MCU7967146.1 YciK family oxidoreductase [gamma proteobacterium symbiont of Bathyaustriella thionipta]